MSAGMEAAIDGPPSMRARALGAALAHAGLPAAVEARDRLAVLHAAPAQLAALHEPDRRRDVVALAARHGFSHVAVELEDDA